MIRRRIERKTRISKGKAAALIGLPGKLGEHGSQVADHVAAGDLERVRAYCETDALNTALLYVRHQHLCGRIAAEAHDRTVRETMTYLEAERCRRPHLGRYLDAWRGLSGTRSAFVADHKAGFR